MKRRAGSLAATFSGRLVGAAASEGILSFSIHLALKCIHQALQPQLSPPHHKHSCSRGFCFQPGELLEQVTRDYSVVADRSTHSDNHLLLR